MKRLMLKIVFCGLVIAWRFATAPTSNSPFLAKATTEGVVRPPSELGITTGSPPSMTATTELVVPKSIPIILLIFLNCSADFVYFRLSSCERRVECALNIIPECLVVNFSYGLIEWSRKLQMGLVNGSPRNERVRTNKSLFPVFVQQSRDKENVVNARKQGQGENR